MTDFRGKTCGDCAWLHANGVFCRRISYGMIPQQMGLNGEWNDAGYFGDVAKDNPACPAFVLKDAPTLSDTEQFIRQMQAAQEATRKHSIHFGPVSAPDDDADTDALIDKVVAQPPAKTVRDMLDKTHAWTETPTQKPASVRIRDDEPSGMAPMHVPGTIGGILNDNIIHRLCPRCKWTLGEDATLPEKPKATFERIGYVGNGKITVLESAHNWLIAVARAVGALDD